MTTELERYVRRISHLLGIVLGSVALALATAVAVGLLVWLARAVWAAALA